jgi:hypothetical protein
MGKMVYRHMRASLSFSSFQHYPGSGCISLNFPPKGSGITFARAIWWISSTVRRTAFPKSINIVAVVSFLEGGMEQTCILGVSKTAEMNLEYYQDIASSLGAKPEE